MTTVTRAGVAVLIIGFAVMFVGGGSRFAIGLVLKPMVEELGWTRSTLGGAAGLFLIVSSVFMFVAGRLSDRFSLKLVLAAGLVIAAAGLGLMMLVTSPWQALLFYGVIFAVGNGIASIAPVSVMVSRSFPGRTGLANALATSGVGIGQLVIIGVLAALLSGIGWRWAFLWLALVNLVLVPAVLFGLVRNAGAGVGASRAPRDGISLREASGHRQFWLLIAVYAICGFQDFLVATHVVAFSLDSGLGPVLSGNLLAFMGLTGVAGIFLAGHWSDRSGPRQPVLFCFVLRIAIFALILVNQSMPAIVAFALLFGVTFWLTAPLLVVFSRDAFGMAHLGSISGLIVMVHHMCGGVGAYVAAVMFDVQGHYMTAFAVLFVLSVVAAGLTAALSRDRPLQRTHSQ